MSWAPVRHSESAQISIASTRTSESPGSGHWQLSSRPFQPTSNAQMRDFWAKASVSEDEESNTDSSTFASSRGSFLGSYDSDSSDDWNITEVVLRQSLLGMTKAVPGGQDGNVCIGVFSVDSSLKELLFFWSATLIKPFSNIKPMGDAADLASHAWEHVLMNLWDEAYGHSSLAVAVNHYQTLTGSDNMGLQKATHHTKAIRALRRRLAAEEVNQVAMGYAISVLSAELAAKDYSAATYHSTFIARCFEPGGEDSVQYPEIFKMPYLWLEIQRAMRTFTRPLIDLDTWAQSFGPSQDYEEFHWSPDKTYSLDCPAVGDLALIKLFAELRHYNKILNSADSDDIPLDRTACIQLSCTLLILHGKILVYCVDKYNAVKSGSLSWLDRFRAAQHAAAALAALWWHRVRQRLEFAGEQAGEIAVTEMHNGDAVHIIGLLEEMLQDSEETASKLLLTDNTKHTPSTLTADLRLRLWTLHIGAIIERAVSFRKRRPAPDYHQMEFKRYLNFAGLDGEDHKLTSRNIYNGFLPLDTNKIYGPRWLNPGLRLWGFMMGPQARDYIPTSQVL